MSVGIIGAHTGGALVRNYGFADSARVVVGVAEFIQNLIRVWPQLERMLIRANRLQAFPLLHFAVTNLYPGVSPSRILVCRSLKITNRVVVVSQPKRFQTRAI